MLRLISIILVLNIYGCTDQGDPIFYSIKNTSSHNLKILLNKQGIKTDTITLNTDESKILDKDVPPYDSGPFWASDSVKLIFDDAKILTYRKLKSNDECINAEKTPYCQYVFYSYLNMVGTFEIDNLEYQKAK